MRTVDSSDERSVADAQLLRSGPPPPPLVAAVADRLLSEESTLEDPVVRLLSAGCRKALRAIRKEASSQPHRESPFKVVPPEDGDGVVAPRSRD